MCKALSNRWDQWAEDNNVVTVPINKWPRKIGGPVDTEIAFQYILGAVLSLDDNNGSGYQQMKAVLLLDLERLENLVTQWLDENRGHFRTATARTPA